MTIGKYIYDLSPPRVALEARAGGSFELVLGLAALTGRRGAEASWVPELADCSRELRAAVAAVGEASAELWLHLLGLALEQPSTDASAFVAAVASTDALELRRHLLGVHVPAWREVAGAETLERAAAGDAAAARALHANDRYYAGSAAEALTQLLPLSPDQTRTRVVAVLERFAREAFGRAEAAVVAQLAVDADAKRELAQRLPATDVVAAAAPGFNYEPEAETPRIVLVPHLAARPWLFLCQHRDMRIICYPVAADEEEETLDERFLVVTRALADPARIRILRRLAGGEASLAEIAELTGLGKSTAHHHLAQLRAVGLVSVSGNARAYRYALARDGVQAYSTLAARFFSPPSR